MKRIISLLLLAAILLVPALTACSNPETTDSGNDTTAAAASDTEESDVDYENMSLLERLSLDYNAVADGLPEADYNGYVFRVHETSRDLGSGNYSVLASIDDSAEIIGDAMYRRQLEIEERFNITFDKFIIDTTDYSTYYNQVNAIFMAQEDAFDMMIVWNTMSGPFAREGYLADLSQISVIDFSKPWFYAEATNALSYKGRKYVSVDLVLPIFSELECVFYNKNLAAEYGLEDMYQVVRDGRWTLDYLKSVTADVWTDLNGNSVVDKNSDIFGLNVPVAQFSYNALPAFGAYIIGKDDSDTPYLYPSVNLERAETVYSTLRTFVKESQGVIYSDWDNTSFAEGRTLFDITNVGYTSSLRDVDFEYGILPLFKWDDAQTEYKSCFLPMPTAIPTTATDKERSGVIMSALAAGGYKKVATAYYETALKTKYAMDEESAEMLDIISSNVVVDGTIMYTDALIYTFLNFMGSSTEFATYWKTTETSAQKYLNNMIEQFEYVISQE